MAPPPPPVGISENLLNQNRRTSDEEELLKEMEEKKVLLPDDVLELFGPRNFTLLMSILSTSVVWALAAMPLMASSFTSSDSDGHMTTIVAEFNLTDDRAYLANMPTSAYMAGNMLGASFISHLADRFGRRPTLIVSLLCLGVFGITSAFSQSFIHFCFCRFLQGSCYAASLVAWVTGYESSCVAIRPFTTLAFGIAWLIGYCLVAPLAMLSNSWRSLLLYVSLPSAIFVMWIYFFVPETLHFLTSNRKEKALETWIQQVSCTGGDKSVLVSRITSDKEDPSKRVNVLREIWSHKIFLVYFFVLAYLWVCDTFVYFGLSLFSTRLSGNEHVNYILMGIVELPAYILTPALCEKMGRRSVVSGSHILAAMAFFALLFFEDTSIFYLPIWLLGKFSISLSFMSLIVLATEVFPTPIRGACVGGCVTLAKIGGIAAPQINFLTEIWVLLPQIVLGTLSLLAGILSLVLPETAKKPLPSSVTQTAEYASA